MDFDFWKCLFAVPLTLYGGDVVYTLFNGHESTTRLWSGFSSASSSESCKAIVNFATSDIPNGRGTPDFLPYDGGSVFKMDVTTLGSILTNRDGNVRHIYWQAAAWL
jgi:hypothetical protein